MDLLKKAQDAIALIAQGRAALAEVADAVSDGRAAIAADTVEEIDALLEVERIENRATNDAITTAIADFRARQD